MFMGKIAYLIQNLSENITKENEHQDFLGGQYNLDIQYLQNHYKKENVQLNSCHKQG